MTLTEIGILFTRGVNLHNQLRFITSQDEVHEPILNKMKAICALQDSEESRKTLQKFIVEHGSEVYREYSRHFDQGFGFKD